MSRTCDALAELRSGLVDGALSPADRERVAGHLLGCAACRADVAELRAVRDLLGRAAPADRPAPGELSSRLISIAGADRAEPLSTRAFRRTRAGVLPSHRRRAQVRSTLGALAAGMVVAVVGVVGWSAAPAADLAAVPDPVDEARAEFGAAVGELSLTGSSLSALMMLDALPAATTDGSDVNRPGTGRGPTLTPAAARRTLQRSTTAADAVSLVGRQTLLVRRGDQLSAAAVEVDTRRGQGSQLSLLAPGGGRLATLFAPAATSAAPHEEVFAVLADAYAFRGQQGAVVAGRPATVVEAVRQGQVAKRWWVDDATGVLLWQESYDPSGGVTVSTGFSTLHVRPASSIIEHLPPRTPASSMTTSLATASAGGLSGSGWVCTMQVAGLSLLELSTDAQQDPKAVHLVYGDGLSTVSVLQQHGRLTNAPRGAVWDPALKAWRHDGAVTWATWQSGGTVFTVTTDGPPALLAAVTASLPRDEPVATTTLGRVRDGWSKILANSKG